MGGRLEYVVAKPRLIGFSTGAVACATLESETPKLLLRSKSSFGPESRW